MTETTTTGAPEVLAGEPNAHGYRSYSLGEFTFSRDEYFAHVTWPTGTHVMSIDGFLRATQRDVAWQFFYGVVNFDDVIGTINHYGNVDLFAGTFNDAYRRAEVDHLENFPHEAIFATFVAMLDDWTNAGFDPFASPEETGSPWGDKAGSNSAAITRKRVTAQRMVGVPGDEPLRTDATHPINRMFADVDQSEPEVHAEPGFEDDVAAFNLFAYLSRSDVTWNPSVVSVCKDSLYCPTTEEYILPIVHGNDRVEWFVQLSDQIEWEVADKESGSRRARVVMKPGDVAAMPADIRHQGYAPKRSMLLVWENGSPDLPKMIAEGRAPTYPVEL
jgi:Hydroquinone 1,2-dioxygenase large subunit N-terminal